MSRAGARAARPARRRRWGRTLLTLHSWAVILFLNLPIAVLIVFSFNRARQTAVWEGFTLDWYLSFAGVGSAQGSPTGASVTYKDKEAPTNFFERRQTTRTRNYFFGLSTGRVKLVKTVEVIVSTRADEPLCGAPARAAAGA